MIDKIVNYIIEEGTTWSTSGNYHIYIEEIEQHTGFNIETIKNNINEVIAALEEREEIVCCDFESDGNFSVYYYLNYCKNVIDEEEE